jgi:hypothetical protein
MSIERSANHKLGILPDFAAFDKALLCIRARLLNEAKGRKQHRMHILKMPP